MRFTIILIPEQVGGFSVMVPALPGCYTQGETREEALAMAREAIALHIESLRAHGEKVPPDEFELASVSVPVAG